MKASILGGLCLFAGLMHHSAAEAQFLKNIAKKIEQKAEQVVERTLDHATAEKPASTASETDKKGSARKGQHGPFKDISPLKNDFARGEKEVFFDDFSADKNGAMASRWTSNGSGTVVVVPGVEGKWLQLQDKNTYKINELFRIPTDFTLEFDVLVLSETSQDLNFNFGFDYQKGVGKHHFLANQNPVNINASFWFNRFEFQSNEVEPKKISEVNATMSYFVNDIMKVKLKVVGDRMHAYVNDFKILDTEMINPDSRKYFYFALDNPKSSSKVHVSNVLISGI